jgi:hypothetical protein
MIQAHEGEAFHSVGRLVLARQRRVANGGLEEAENRAKPDQIPVVGETRIEVRQSARVGVLSAKVAMLFLEPLGALLVVSDITRNNVAFGTIAHRLERHSPDDGFRDCESLLKPIGGLLANSHGPEELEMILVEDPPCRVG